MIGEHKRHLQYFVEKFNDLSISLFSARQEITNLRRMIAIDFEAIERLIAEKNLLSEKCFRLQTELQKLQPVEAAIQDLLISANLYSTNGEN
jgi:hypothetical protein